MANVVTNVVPSDEPEIPDTLPNLPSQLLRLAVRDLQKCSVSPKYTIDMFEWHTPVEDEAICQVCLAGSVMVQECNILDDADVCWGRQTDRTSPYVFVARYRRQETTIRQYFARSLSEKLNALNQWRNNLPKLALSTLQLVSAITYNLFRIAVEVPWEPVPVYAEDGSNTDEFVAVLLRNADAYEKVGA